jgi:hypothetical protein
VNVGWPKAVGCIVVVIVPLFLLELKAQVEILNRTVSPGCTLLSEAVTTR